MISAHAKVPPGVRSGQPFHVQINGMLYQVVCPPNAVAGQTILVQVPAPAVAVAQPVAPAPSSSFASMSQPAPSSSSYPASYPTSMPSSSYSSNYSASLPPPFYSSSSYQPNYSATPMPSSYNPPPSASSSSSSSLHRSAPPPPPPPSSNYGAPAPMPPALISTASVALGARVLCCKNHIVDENAPAMREHGIKSMYEGEEANICGGTLESGLPPPYSDYVMVQFDDGRRGKISRYVLRKA